LIALLGLIIATALSVLGQDLWALLDTVSGEIASVPGTTPDS